MVTCAACVLWGIGVIYLERISWNLEPHYEKYKKAVVKKSIEKAIRENRCEREK